MFTRIAGLRRDEEGFTLIELLVVVAIIALLATLALPRVYEAINKSKDNTAKGELATISGALERYYMDKGKYPKSLTELKTATAGYLKTSVSLKNKFDLVYFYAVDDMTKPLHYVLADPGKKEALLSDGLCRDASKVGSVPEGLNLAPSGNTMVFWKTGSGASGVAGALEQKLDLKVIGTSATATACDTTLTGAGIEESLSTWVPIRTDLVTE